MADVDVVPDACRTPHARPIHHATVGELRWAGAKDVT
jgi:hypothetical protein